MAYDYSKLKGRIIEKCGTLSEFAKLMGLSERTISLKLTNKVDWNQSDMQKAIAVLDLLACDISTYFFKLKVQNI